MISPRALYHTEDRTQIVEFGDVRARFLIACATGEVPPEYETQVAAYLAPKPTEEPKAEKPKSDKAVKPGDNK
jgi:hypothetical protein